MLFFLKSPKNVLEVNFCFKRKVFSEDFFKAGHHNACRSDQSGNRNGMMTGDLTLSCDLVWNGVVH